LWNCRADAAPVSRDDFNYRETEGVPLTEVTQFHDKHANVERVLPARMPYLHPRMQRPI